MTRLLVLFTVLGSLWLPERALAVDYNCVPIDVTVLSDRIAVTCAEPRDIRGGFPRDGAAVIRFFAVSLSDSRWADRFLQVANAAMSTGLMVQYKFTAGDTSGTAFGCAANDCRAPWAFLLMGRGQSRTP